MTDEKRSWVSQQDLTSLSDAMNVKYAQKKGDRIFRIDAKKDEGRVLVTVLLCNEDSSFHYPVEGRILYENEDMMAGEAAIFLIDYIDMYFEEFFGSDQEEVYLPIDWSDHQYDAVDFQIRGQIRNKKLEVMADDLLKNYADI